MASSSRCHFVGTLNDLVSSVKEVRTNYVVGVSMMYLACAKPRQGR